MYEIVPSELKVLHPRPGTAVVEVLGEHDLGTSDETARLLARLVGENELVVVDLSETQFIDSSFLKTLKNAQQSAKELGHTVLLQVGHGADRATGPRAHELLRSLRLRVDARRGTRMGAGRPRRVRRGVGASRAPFAQCLKKLDTWNVRVPRTSEGET